MENFDSKSSSEVTLKPMTGDMDIARPLSPKPSSEGLGFHKRHTIAKPPVPNDQDLRPRTITEEQLEVWN